MVVIKRVGDDLYLYFEDHVTIVENYYKNRRKKKRKKKKKEKVKKSHINKIVYTICLIEIIVTAYIITTPFTKFTSNKIEFNFGLLSKNYIFEFNLAFSKEFSLKIENPLINILPLNLLSTQSMSKETDTKALFLSIQKRRYALHTINHYIKNCVIRLNIEKRIPYHTFRRTLNTLRKRMGCPKEDRKILLCHKVSDVNFNCYVKLNYYDYIQLYDKWNPYKNILDSKN